MRRLGGLTPDRNGATLALSVSCPIAATALAGATQGE